jgi:oxygen-independent coproporphyrinogen-3 oxidase
MGMQSASKADLEILGRKHTFRNVQVSVDNARKAGFSNINLDLIFGIPYQSPASFMESLQAASNLCPSHLSLYALSIK